MSFPIKYLVRKRALGDVLWIEPVIKELAKTCRLLIVHTKYNELFNNYPLPNVRFKLKLNFFEKMLIALSGVWPASRIVVDLEGAYERYPNQHFLHAYQKRAGVKIMDQYPELFLSELERNRFRNGINGKKFIVIHPENSQLVNYRKVHGVSWADLVRSFNSEGYSVVCLGDKLSKVVGAIYLETTLRQLISLLAQAQLFIGIDSGPSHIAAALKIPSILLFGAVNPYYRHFNGLFKGIILKNKCCFDGENHGFASSQNSQCAINPEMPPCTIFNNQELFVAVQKLVHLPIEKNEGN